MANKKISELTSRTPALSDLMIVGDPSSGYSYKCTVTALATIIETDIADGYVTIGTTQTISGAKTFSNNLTLTSVANATTTQTKFLTLNGSNVVNYRTGAEVLSDIGGQAALSGTGIVKSTGGTISYLTDNSSNWNSAYDNMIVSAAVTGTTTKTLTLTQQDAGTITASWTDINTDAVTSVFGRTGAVVATEGDYNLTQLGDVLITTPSTNQVLRYNGAQWVNDTGYFGTVTSVGLSTGTTGTDISVSGSPITSSGTITLNIPTASATNRGALSSTDWSTFNNKQNALTLTTTGTSGAATLVGSTLNIPQYQAALTNPVTGTGTTNYIPKFTSSSAIGNSNFITDASGNLGIGAVSLGSGLRLYVVQASGEGNPTLDGSEVALFQRNFVSAQSSSIAITSGSASTSSLYFGDKDNVSIGKLTYDNSSNAMIFHTNSSERMRLDASGNLGLGTSSPSARFHSYTTGQTAGLFQSTQSEVNLRLDNSSATSNFFGATGANFYWYSGGTERMRLDASGNLGLGITPSAWSLGKAMQFTSGAVWSLSTTDMNYLTNTNYDGSFKYVNSTRALRYFQDASTGIHAWYNAPSGTAGNAISFTQAMTLDASGRLGIGQTSPQYRLDVYGGARIENAGEASIIFRNNTWGNFTIGQSAYSLGGGFLSIGAASAIMTFDGTNQRVGIGTTSPYTKLELVGPATNYSNSASIVFTDNVNTTDSRRWLVGNVATNYGSFNIASSTTSTGDPTTPRFTITKDGNVGIGTTSPTQLLQVAGNEINSTKINAVGTVYGSGAFLNAFSSAGGNDVGFAGFIASQNNNTTNRLWMGVHSPSGANQAFVGTPDSTPLAFWTNATERMRITSGGDVGIGTTNPDTKLQVAGTGATGFSVRSNSSGDAFMRLYIDGTAYSDYYVDRGTSDVYLRSTTPANLIFSTNLSERMRITSGGELLINTTTDNGDYKLQVNGNTLLSGTLQFTVSGSIQPTLQRNGSSGGLIVNTTAAASVANLFEIKNNGVTKFNIVASSDAAEFAGSIKTAAPSGGTAKPWKLGEAGVTLGGSNTSGVRVEIDGVVYYLVTGYLP